MRRPCKELLRRGVVEHSSRPRIRPTSTSVFRRASTEWNSGARSRIQLKQGWVYWLHGRVALYLLWRGIGEHSDGAVGFPKQGQS